MQMSCQWHLTSKNWKLLEHEWMQTHWKNEKITTKQNLSKWWDLSSSVRVCKWTKLLALELRKPQRKSQIISRTAHSYCLLVWQYTKVTLLQTLRAKREEYATIICGRTTWSARVVMWKMLNATTFGKITLLVSFSFASSTFSHFFEIDFLYAILLCWIK